MNLNLERPIIFFDIESTGLNIASDAIIELSFVKVYPDAKEEIKTWKIKPWDYQNARQIPINPSASEVNGIKDEDLKDCPRFIEVVEEIVDMMRDCDLAGFNSTKFDLPMLVEEIERVKSYCESRIALHGLAEDKKNKAKQVLAQIDIDLHACTMVDVQNIYHFMEPRNLRAAYRFYCGGKDFENAHSAEADTLATYEVLKAQLDKYSTPNPINNLSLKNDIKSLSELNSRAKAYDFAARIILKNGVPTINFGKHSGKSVKEVFDNERSYFAWIANGDFTLDTKRQFRRLEEQYKQELLEESKKEPSQEALEQLKLNFNSK